MESVKRKAEYRNSIRSRTLIRNALLSLMQEKEFSKITVTDIVNRADINRGTFYAHFASPEDVLAKIQHDFFSGIETLFHGVEPESLLHDPEPVLREVSRYILQDKSFYQILLSVSDPTQLTECYSQGLSHFLTSGDILKKVKSPSEYRMAIYFVVCGVLALYLEALKDYSEFDLEELPSVLTQYIRNIIEPCFAK
jgi:Transcriptional regulator